MGLQMYPEFQDNIFRRRAFERASAGHDEWITELGVFVNLIFRSANLQTGTLPGIKP